MKIKKLCVAIPNLGSIKVETVMCLLPSLFHTVIETGCGLHFVMPYGSLIDENRNESVKAALEVKASHLMFIDSDMTFPDNGILTLASRDKLVIGANYNRRTLPLSSTVKIADENGMLLEVKGDQIPKYPFKCYAVATGFMLIRTEIFKDLEKPWFFFGWDPVREKTIGEDVDFCKKVQAKGIDVWCDPTMDIKHIGDYAY